MENYTRRILKNTAMKRNFTEIERKLIESIVETYHIQICIFTNSVFKGFISENTQITLNGTRFLQLLNTSNVIYIKSCNNILELIIIAQ